MSRIFITLTAAAGSAKIHKLIVRTSSRPDTKLMRPKRRTRLRLTNRKLRRDLEDMAIGTTGRTSRMAAGMVNIKAIRPETPCAL